MNSKGVMGPRAWLKGHLKPKDDECEDVYYQEFERRVLAVKGLALPSYKKVEELEGLLKDVNSDGFFDVAKIK